VHSHHNSSTLDVVEAHLTMERLGFPDGERRWMAVSLSYDPADPWAVALDLYVGPAAVRWTFGRELLVAGLHEPVGEGDVLVSPSLDDAGRAVVVIELRSPDGSLVGQLPARDVGLFVRGVLDTVPAGAETAHLDVDALVDLMLHPDGEHGRP
jgi:sporulation and cell division protein SsgA